MKMTARSVAFALALVPALARAANDAMTDERLITLLHHVNQDEIAAGKMAQKKGRSADIKDYGKRLVADHTKSDHEVMAAAQKSGVKPNDSALTGHDKEMMRVEQKKAEQLERLSGPEFDKAFAQEMSRDHAHLVSMLRDAKKQVSAPVREVVDTTIPVLEQHKDLADKAAKNLTRSQARAPQPVKR